VLYDSILELWECVEREGSCQNVSFGGAGLFGMSFSDDLGRERKREAYKMKPERAADMLLSLWIVGWMDERCAVSSLMIGSTCDFEDVDCVHEYARYVVSGQ